MALRSPLTRLAAEFLLGHRGRRFSARELAEGLLAAYPERFAAKRKAFEAKHGGKSVAYQLAQDLRATAQDRSR